MRGAEQPADRGLAFGFGVQVAHGAFLSRQSFLTTTRSRASPRQVGRAFVLKVR
jgi:hypothetical protein